MWKCPKCGCISSTFNIDGLCECGEKINFITWESYYAYEGINHNPVINSDKATISPDSNDEGYKELFNILANGSE